MVLELLRVPADAAQFFSGSGARHPQLRPHRHSNALGWAAGVERLALMVGEAPAGARPVALIPMGDAAEAKCRSLAQTLREGGVAVELGYSGNMKKRLKRADKANAKLAVILGDDELANGVAQLRDLDSGEQQEVALDQLADVIGKK